MLDLGYWFPKPRRLHFEGNSLLQTLTLGGVDGEGNDACNELTLTILDAVRSIRCNQPTFNFRYHPKIAEAALDGALEVVKTGMGMPAFLNDRVMIESLLDEGVSLREARNWAVVGCVSAAPVNMQITTKRLAQSCIIAKCFEFALTNGECMLTGKQLAPRTGDPARFSFDDLVEAFREQVEYSFQYGARVRNITRVYEAEYLQRPLASALHRSPLEVRKDVSEYEDAPNLWINCVGMVDVVDSLQAIKQLVFEERRLSLGELVQIRAPQLGGQEALRQTCLNKVPKFGNAQEQVDELAARHLQAGLGRGPAGQGHQRRHLPHPAAERVALRLLGPQDRSAAQRAAARRLPERRRHLAGPRHGPQRPHRGAALGGPRGPWADQGDPAQPALPPRCARGPGRPRALQGLPEDLARPRAVADPVQRGEHRHAAGRRSETPTATAT